MSINKQTLIRAGLRAQPPWLGAQGNMSKNLFFKNWVFCACLFFLSLSDCLIAFTCHYIYINILHLISAEAELLSVFNRRTRGKNTRSTMFYQLKIWLLRHFTYSFRLHNGVAHFFYYIWRVPHYHVVRNYYRRQEDRWQNDVAQNI